MMKTGVPSVETAAAVLVQAKKINPGDWAGHSRITAECAGRIAANTPGMDTQTAYVLGLLHDIGRARTKGALRHVYDGWIMMREMGFDLAAKICLTHSFQIQKLSCFVGKIDLEPQELQELERALLEARYDDYDRLIQLCDALAYPDRPVCIEKRLVEVTRRHGFRDTTLEKWEAIFSLKQLFDDKTGTDLYKIIGVTC